MSRSKHYQTEMPGLDSIQKFLPLSTLHYCSDLWYTNRNRKMPMAEEIVTFPLNREEAATSAAGQCSSTYHQPWHK